MARLIGTAGHVDHGKTTLIRALTGIDADRLPEEKSRGLTIDVGFAYVDLPEIGRASIVDVPGHERFLTNMLVGAMGTDVALLCIAADSSIMPQTVEHFQIIELLPVERLVVALTRSDLVDAETLEIVRAEVEEMTAPTRFKGSPIVPVSAVTGTGLDDLKSCLAHALAVGDASKPGPWYLPIDRAFTIKGHGVVVTGTLAQGEVNEGDRAVIQPDGHEVRVRSIQSHEQQTSKGERGRRTALNLSGIKIEDAQRGQVVGSPEVVFSTTTLDGTVRWLVRPRHGSRVRVSIGADEAIARTFLNDSDESLVQFRFERPVAAVQGQPFIVRKYSPSSLLGGGRVTVPQATVRRKSEKATRTTGGTLEDSVISAVGQSKDGMQNEDLCRVLGKTPQALGDTLESLKASGRLHGFAGLWMTTDQLTASTAKFCAALQSLHDGDPTSLFQSRESVVKTAGLDWKGKPLDRILSHLVETGVVRQQGTAIALSTFRVKFSDKQRAILDRVIDALSAKGVSTPSPDEVADALKVPRPAVHEIIKVGCAAGEIVRIEDGIYIPSKTLDGTVSRLREEFADRQFSAAEFREAFGTSRKYAIPLLEHLDSRGVTKRLGDVRVVVKRVE